SGLEEVEEAIGTGETAATTQGLDDDFAYDACRFIQDDLADLVSVASMYPDCPEWTGSGSISTLADQRDPCVIGASQVSSAYNQVRGVCQVVDEWEPNNSSASLTDFQVGQLIMDFFTLYPQRIEALGVESGVPTETYRAASNYVSYVMVDFVLRNACLNFCGHASQPTPQGWINNRASIENVCLEHTAYYEMRRRWDGLIKQLQFFVYGVRTSEFAGSLEFTEEELEEANSGDSFEHYANFVTLTTAADGEIWQNFNVPGFVQALPAGTVCQVSQGYCLNPGSGYICQPDSEGSALGTCMITCTMDGNPGCPQPLRCAPFETGGNDGQCLLNPAEDFTVTSTECGIALSYNAFFVPLEGDSVIQPNTPRGANRLWSQERLHPADPQDPVRDPMNYCFSGGLEYDQFECGN
ncbi:MAG: hypothetical protein KC561_11190, partial [Myxococcales bacterium]|nr:hypothetical protein [Myxococcales bacterium]